MNEDRRDEWVEPVDETGDRQHVNPDGETDALKGARMGGIGGAIAGGVAGSAIGPAGTLAGAVIGGVVGLVASGAAVAAVDTMDGDSTTDHPQAVVDNGMPGIQTGGYANDGTPDTRGMAEKTADAVTGDNIDDKTGKVVDDRTNWSDPAPISWSDRPISNRYDLDADESLGNGLPGIQTGGYANDGTPDTRGISEKVADAVTGDTLDDKTGKVVDHSSHYADNDLPDQPEYRDTWTNLPERRFDLDAPELRRDLPPDNRHDDTYLEPIGNGIPGIQTGGRAEDGTPDTRGISEKTADALTGDNVDDKTGKRVS